MNEDNNCMDFFFWESNVRIGTLILVEQGSCSRNYSGITPGSACGTTWDAKDWAQVDLMQGKHLVHSGPQSSFHWIHIYPLTFFLTYKFQKYTGISSEEINKLKYKQANQIRCSRKNYLGLNSKPGIRTFERIWAEERDNFLLNWHTQSAEFGIYNDRNWEKN